MMNLREHFAVVKLDPESEMYQIEIEGEGYWIPIHISALGFNPPAYDWNIPGHNCPDEDHKYDLVTESKFKKHTSFQIYQHFGNDEMVIKLDPNFLFTGLYEKQVIDSINGLKPPHARFTQKTSLRTKAERIDAASIWLNQEMPGTYLCVNYVGRVIKNILAEDPMNFTLICLPEDLFEPTPVQHWY